MKLYYGINNGINYSLLKYNIYFQYFIYIIQVRPPVPTIIHRIATLLGHH